MLLWLILVKMLEKTRLLAFDTRNAFQSLTIQWRNPFQCLDVYSLSIVSKLNFKWETPNNIPTLKFNIPSSEPLKSSNKFKQIIETFDPQRKFHYAYNGAAHTHKQTNTYTRTFSSWLCLTLFHKKMAKFQKPNYSSNVNCMVLNTDSIVVWKSRFTLTRSLLFTWAQAWK